MKEKTGQDKDRAATAEARNRILKARAKALASERQEERADAEHIEVVEFLLAGEKYGIETCRVRNVHPLKDLTPLPGSPTFVLGMVNVAGRILAVVDIKKLFDLPDRGLTDLDKIVIVDHDGGEIGILADVIAGVRRILLADLQPPLATLTGIRKECLRGVTGDRTAILDPDRLFAHEKILTHEKEDRT